MNNDDNRTWDLIWQIMITVVTCFVLLALLPTLLPFYRAFGVVISVGILCLAAFFYFKKQRELFSVIKLTSNFYFLFIVILLLIFYSTKILVLTDESGFESILRDHISMAKWIYFMICFAQPIILPIPEAVTVAAGSAVLGPFTALYLGFLGSLSGILTMYAIARFGGVKLVSRFVKETHMQRYKEYVRKNETIILVLMFIIPILPDEIITVGAGISGVSFRKFIWIASLSKLFTSTIVAYSIPLANVLSLTGTQMMMGGSLVVGFILFITVLMKRTLMKKQGERQL
ncbi:TVP38/TMEM64 family protein [Peribacillus acanthi]|uniref:TVP38/TMEM64 family protein n=1 Tax=Peribacillus acanthi TaxID=2171554 RepID=UPI001F0C0332|nr:VTT domain-containing protein [Peribacillus acanthi]